MKKRMKEEEKGDYGPPTRKVFLRFCWTQSTKGPICVSYTVFHDPAGRSSERKHNRKKRDDGISSGRRGRKGLA